MNAIRAIHPYRHEGLRVFDEGLRSAISPDISPQRHRERGGGKFKGLAKRRSGRKRFWGVSAAEDHHDRSHPWLSRCAPLACAFRTQTGASAVELQSFDSMKTSS